MKYEAPHTFLLFWSIRADDVSLSSQLSQAADDILIMAHMVPNFLPQSLSSLATYF